MSQIASTEATDLRIDFRLGTSPSTGRQSLTIVVDDFPAAALVPIFAAAVLSSLQSALSACGTAPGEGQLH